MSNIIVKWARDKVKHHENELQTERIKNSPACTHFHRTLLARAKRELAELEAKYPEA